MNTSELITELSRRVKLSKKETEHLLDQTIAEITDQLSKNQIVSIQNFGSLEVRKREERVSVNPGTGKKMLIPPKLIVGYKASPTLKEKIKHLGCDE